MIYQNKEKVEEKTTVCVYQYQVQYNNKTEKR